MFLIAGQVALLAAALVAAVLATHPSDWHPWSLFFSLLTLALVGEFLAVGHGQVQLGPAFAKSSPSASASSAGPSSPIRTAPSTTAIVAGTAPSRRTTSSSSRATSRLRPRGSPWAISVLSSATTGTPAASALATAGAMSMSPAVMAAAILGGADPAVRRASR